MNDPFEQHIKQSLENFEEQYNPSDWNDLQNRMSKVKAGNSSGFGKGLLIAASAAVVAGAIYYFSGNNSQDNKAKNTVTASQNNIQIEAKENPVKPELAPAEKKIVEEKNVRIASPNRSAEKSDNVKQEKVPSKNNISEKNPDVSVKAEDQKTNPPIENKITNQNPLQPSTISVPKASIHSNANTVCENIPVQFQADNNEMDCTYKWYFGDGQSSSEQNPQHIYQAAGSFSVKLHVTSIKDKKVSEQLVKNLITVQPAPSVDFSYTPSDDNKLILVFDGSADNANSWNWDFGDGRSSSEENPTHTFAKYNTYKVTATAKNNFGCTSAAVKNVVVDNQINLLAPTSFSPNGDGINDTWMPVALQSGDYDFTITVYNQTNTVVFTTSDKNNSWNGANTKEGDTFTWKALVKEKNGMQSTYQGFIIIKQ